jgi:thiamine-phosphate pyrophosphorylase
LLLYYITDRSLFPGDEASRRRHLLRNIAQAVLCGVDYLQLREKDLSTHHLETLTREAVAIVQQLRAGNKKLRTSLLVNSRTDIALVCGADGVHLRSADIAVNEVRRIWAHSDSAIMNATVGVSCHSPSEVANAAVQGADFAVFGPIFEKAQSHVAGTGTLREACRERIPVLALGGVTLENAGACIKAGAAGIAGIRLFQQNEIGKVIAALRHQPSAREELG